MSPSDCQNHDLRSLNPARPRPDTVPPPEVREVVRLASLLCETPSGRVVLAEEEPDTSWSAGAPEDRGSHGSALKRYVLSREEAFEVSDTFADPRFAADTPPAAGRPGTRFCAGAPIVSEDGSSLGVLCVLDERPRTLTEAQRDGLRVLARLVGRSLDGRRAGARLEETRQTLATTSALARSMLHSGRDCLKILSLDGRLLEMGEPGKRLMCVVDFECIRNADWSTFWEREEDREQVHRVLAAARAGESAQFVGNTSTLDGTRKWWDVMVSPIPGPDGEPERILAVSRDITDLKDAEQELREFNEQLEESVRLRSTELEESERRFRSTFEQAAVGLALGGADGRFMRVNRGLCEIVGYSAEELAELTFADITHPEDLAADQAQVARLFANEIDSYTLEKRYIHKNGDPVWVSLTGSLVRNDEGEVDYGVAVVVDIAARKRAEEELREARDFSAVMLDSLPGTFYCFDQTNVLQQWNENFQQVSGYTAAELAAMSPLDFFDGDDEERVQEAMAEVVATGESSVEASFVAKDGTRTPYLYSGRLADIGGEQCLIGMGVDISQRKQAEAALRESEARYRELFATNPHPMWIYDVDSLRFVAVNKMAVRLYGYSREEFLGMTIADIRPPEDVQALIEDVDQRQENLQRSDGWRHRKKNGELIDVVVASHALPDRGGNRHRVVAIQDVTESLRAREQVEASLENLRAIFDSVNAAICIYTTEGRLLQVNDKLLELFDCSSAALAELALLGALLGPDTPRQELESVSDDVLSGRPRSVHWNARRPDDDTTFPAEIFLRKIEWDGEDAVMAVIHDLTEKKALEQQLLRTQRLESLGTLASGVAHDLNNALAPILLGTELLRMDYPDESETLDAVQASAKRGSDMVRQLLAFARGAEGERAPIYPLHLLEEIEKILKATFPKNIDLQFDYDRELPLVMGDATQLHQVLLNLCVNARDAMPGGGTLTLEAGYCEIDSVYTSAAPDAHAGTYLQLQVGDSGAGIPKGIVDKIFDPFFTTKGPTGGTGLGLSTVLGIVQGHGGFVEVDSRPGEGSTFRIYIPTDQETAEVIATREPTVPLRGNGEAILYVDDEAAMRDIARAVLRNLDFEPIIAADGVDALMKVAEHRANLRAVITDLRMPDMDGLSLVRALERVLPGVPVAVASGHLEDAALVEFEALGVAGRLDKPFTQQQLEEALSGLLSVGGSNGAASS